MRREPDPVQMAFIEKMNAWLTATGTNFTCLCRAADVNTSIRFYVQNGTVVNPEFLRSIQAAMDANPGGIARPSRKATAGTSIGDSEVQARADEVARRRDQRARDLLAQELPGFNGKRAGSMRPVWEQVA
ncbi:MAG: hypothetical protein ACK4ZW_08470 [Blastomonas sp.]